jgi:hypothetical protein
MMHLAVLTAHPCGEAFAGLAAKALTASGIVVAIYRGVKPNKSNEVLDYYVWTENDWALWRDDVTPSRWYPVRMHRGGLAAAAAIVRLADTEARSMQ